jgi:glycosyltransferase involved in cell wall biosynthesis
MAKQMEPELTVIIPTYNNPEGAIDLVHDFYRLHNPEMFRIISIDQTLEGIHFRDKEPVHLQVRTHRNLGFSKAMNTGWKLVQTPYTLLANDDVRLLDPRWYEEAKTDLERQDVLATNPFPATRTWDRHGNVVWLWDLEREIEGIPQGKLDDRFDFVKNKDFEQYTPEDYDKLKAIHGKGSGPGTAMFFTLLWTNARNWVGLLDEAYWNNGEDYDWNRRCYLTCWKCKRRKSQHTFDNFCPNESTLLPHLTDKGNTAEGSRFEPCHILTSKNALIHHQAGVTKQKAEAKGEGSTFNTLSKAKNIFNEKWNITKEGPRDIYGDNGTLEPSRPWWTEVPL